MAGPIHMLVLSVFSQGPGFNSFKLKLKTRIESSRTIKGMIGNEGEAFISVKESCVLQEIALLTVHCNVGMVYLVLGINLGIIHPWK